MSELNVALTDLATTENMDYVHRGTPLAPTQAEHYTNKKSVDDLVGDRSLLRTQDQSTLVAALNELFSYADNGKTALASVIGLPTTPSDTFAQIGDRLGQEKSRIASFLAGRGVAAGSGETLASLTGKLPNVPKPDAHAYKYRLLTLADFPAKPTSDPNVAEGRYFNSTTIYFPGWTPIFCFVDGHYYTSTADTNYQVRGAYWIAWNPAIFGLAEHVATSNSAGTNTFRAFSEVHFDGNLNSNPGTWASASAYAMHQNNVLSWPVGSLVISKLTRSANYGLQPKFCLSVWRKEQEK